MNTQNTQDDIKHVFQFASDGTIDVRRVPKGQVSTELPPAVFSVQFDPERGMYLRPENDYKITGRVYGDVDTHVDHFLRSYELNDKNLGVALIGEAGSGKTLKLKRLVMKAKELGMPTILVNAGYGGEGFVGFINSIAQQCVVAFDEFDKTYSNQNDDGNRHASMAQTTILQLLDGVSAGNKKLFVLTLNDESMLSEYMKDRPSRVRYRVMHSRMELPTVMEYVQDNLQSCAEDHLHAFAHMALTTATCGSIGSRAAGMNFDSMRELVTEMNQFKCSLTECLKMMSQTGPKTSATFSIDIFENGSNEKAYTTAAHGFFDGPYVGSSKYEIALSVRVPSVDGKFPFDYEREELTRDDFIGFGETPEVLEFRKGDRQFICRYTNISKYNDLTLEISEERGDVDNSHYAHYSRGPAAVIPDKKHKERAAKKLLKQNGVSGAIATAKGDEVADEIDGVATSLVLSAKHLPVARGPSGNGRTYPLNLYPEPRDGKMPY